MGRRRRAKKQLRATVWQTNVLASQNVEMLRSMQTGQYQQAVLHTLPGATRPGQWAPDPGQRYSQRYHDGSQWTQYVMDSAGVRHFDPPG